MRKSVPRAGVPLALGIYLVWTAATWVFEGRIQTLLRPDAVADRLAYALLVNLLLGVVGSMALLRWLVRGKLLAPHRCGFPAPQRTGVSIVLGFGLGLAGYFAQGAPTADPVVLLNAYSQVFVVSAAEVLVCWAVVGSVVEARLAPAWGRAATVAAGVLASALFGLYHFAHSAPFNTWPMVALLSGVGLLTAAFFFASRDALATTVFHNFLGTFGVTKALAEADALAPLATLQIPLVGTALLAAAVMLGGYAWVRQGAGNGRSAPKGEW